MPRALASSSCSRSQTASDARQLAPKWLSVRPLTAKWRSCGSTVGDASGGSAPSHCRAMGGTAVVEPTCGRSRVADHIALRAGRTAIGRLRCASLTMAANSAAACCDSVRVMPHGEQAEPKPAVHRHTGPLTRIAVDTPTEAAPSPTAGRGRSGAERSAPAGATSRRACTLPAGSPAGSGSPAGGRQAKGVYVARGSKRRHETCCKLQAQNISASRRSWGIIVA